MMLSPSLQTQKTISQSTSRRKKQPQQAERRQQLTPRRGRHVDKVSSFASPTLMFQPKISFAGTLLEAGSSLAAKVNTRPFTDESSHKDLICILLQWSLSKLELAFKRVIVGLLFSRQFLSVIAASVTIDNGMPMSLMKNSCVGTLHVLIQTLAHPCYKSQHTMFVFCTTSSNRFL